ncbi:MAG: PPC domain-containing DNA-binding protein [Gemmatimonadales bacterium]|jgi:predicted DNA-binding protein with PD1-like motif
MAPLQYRECRDGRRFMLRIKPGAKLVEQIRLFAREVGLRHGVVVSAIGSVRQLTFTDIQAGAHLPITEPRMPVHTVEGPLDLLGIEGNFVPRKDGEVDAHLHILGSKSSGEVVGGHLIEAEVFATCEMVVAEYFAKGVGRQRSAKGGVDTIFFEDDAP